MTGKCVLLITLAWVLCGSAAAHQRDDAVGDAVEHLGTFSQYRETGEHVYGYALRLWRDGGAIVGLWSRAEGQPADFPTVVVEDLRFDEADGSLRFSARWCDDVEKFEGTWKGKKIAGQIQGREAPVKVVLIGGDPDWPPTTRAEWRARIDEIVRIRAPRCR